MTRILILDGDARAPGTLLDRAIAALAAEARGDTCQRLRLAELTLHQCVGCFGCWLKTPGRCRLRDDGPQLHAAMAVADLVVFASPLRMGFTSALLKRATDRIIPNFLPYIEVVKGESHHLPRYGRDIDLGLLVERCDATDGELAATEQIYRRLARNLRGRFAWLRLAAAEEVSDALHAA
jgi:hypothetical protein